MSLRFIVGRAGYGKTSLCCEEICRRLADGRDDPLILLVPEQATYQNELALALKNPRGGLWRAQVLSFRRLAWRVLNEVGGASRVFVSDLGRRMILRGIIERRKKDLAVFGRAADRPGFTNVLTSFLSELKMYRVFPGQLSQAAGEMEEGLKSRLTGKLKDIDLVYSDLENHLRGRYVDPDDYMNLLADSIHLSPSMAGAEVWVDGFSGFTPQEYVVLEKLMKAALRVNVALCADRSVLKGVPGEGEVFHSTGDTLHRLKDIAQKSGVTVEPAAVLGKCHRFVKARALGHLEKKYFGGGVIQFPGEPPEIKIVAAAGPRAEVEAAAREITRLCRDEGYRWREIAVLVRDIGRYHVLAGTVFNDYGIPFFIDHKGSVTHHPLVELIRSALEVVSGGWNYDPVFRYLKTDLAPVEREEVDVLENCVLAHGIRGTAWTDERDWDYKRGSLERDEAPAEDRVLIGRVNRARREGLKALKKFYDSVRTERPTVRSMSEALFNLLVELDIPSRLVDWSDRAESEGNLTRAVEHDRIWGQVVDLLDQVVAAFGDDAVSPEKFAGILEAGIVSLRLGLIPPGLDQVTVGSLDRSRSPDIRAALVLGVNDGVFPARQVEDGILTDMERESLAEKGVKLAPGSRKNVLYEQFMVYTALTRASDYLWVSYCTADGEGRSMLPSRIVGRIKELLPGVRERRAEVEPSGAGEEDMEFVAEGGRTLGYLAARIRDHLSEKEIHGLWWDVYNWYIRKGDTPPLHGHYSGGVGGMSPTNTFQMVLAGLFYRNTEGNISPGLAGKFYGDVLLAGISGIEEFSSCPFAYFLSHGIKLKERPHYKVTPPDLGQFFHAALKLFAERLRRDSLDWGDLEGDAITRLAGEIVDLLAPRLQNEILLSSARHRHLVTRLKRRLARSAAVLAYQAGRGKFRPVGLEVKFGPGEALPPLSVSLPGGRRLEIAGRIDRIDACQWDRGNRIVVIDYKSGFNNIDPAGIYYGVNIQLPAYLDVAVANSRLLTGREGQPGGIFYFTVADPLIRTEGPVSSQEAEKLKLKRLRMRGLLLADRDLVKMLDAGMDRQSDVIPVSLTAKGEFHKSSPVISEDQFRHLRAHLKRLYGKAGREILAGRVGIEPIRLKGRAACRFCKFRAVCQFDPALPENRYRIPPAADDGRIWQMISRSGGENDE